MRGRKGFDDFKKSVFAGRKGEVKLNKMTPESGKTILQIFFCIPRQVFYLLFSGVRQHGIQRRHQNRTYIKNCLQRYFFL